MTTDGFRIIPHVVHEKSSNNAPLAPRRYFLVIVSRENRHNIAGFDLERSTHLRILHSRRNRHECSARSLPFRYLTVGKKLWNQFISRYQFLFHEQNIISPSVCDINVNRDVRCVEDRSCRYYIGFDEPCLRYRSIRCPDFHRLFGSTCAYSRVR